MEVIVAVLILSVVMIALLQIKSNNIFLLDKSKENSKYYDFALASMDLAKSGKINKKIYLDAEYDFKKDDIRREFKDIKIEVKGDKIDKTSIKLDSINFNIISYETMYNIDNKIKKKLYSFKLEL